MRRISLRRWFAFRLRSLFVVVTLLAIGIAWVARERQQSRRELELLRLFGGQAWNAELVGPFDEPGGLSNSKGYQNPYQQTLELPQSSWQRVLTNVLGPRVGGFYLVAPAGSDLAPLAEFSRLRKLSLHADPGTNLAPLARLTQLESLSMIAPSVSDFSVLAELKNLRAVDLDGTKISDLSPLGGLAQLEELRIRGTPVRDLSPLLRLGNLRKLQLGEPYVSNTIIHSPSELENLRRLALENPDIDYSALIEEAAQEPAIRQAKVQQMQLKDLLEANPHCRVNSSF